MSAPTRDRDEAVVEAIEAIDSIPQGDHLQSVRVWQYADDLGDARLAGKWAWTVVQSHESGSGSSGRGDGGTSRKLAKMTLVRGEDAWPKR